MTDKHKERFEKWFSVSILPVSKSDEGYYTKEALEWCWEVAFEKGVEHIPALVGALKNIDYHNDLLSEVSRCADFLPSERAMQIANLQQACLDGAEVLAALPAEWRGE